MKTWNLLTPSLLAFGALVNAQTPTVFSTSPTSIAGQSVLQTTTITAVAPNLVEGREFFSPQSAAVDTSVSPNILYVADNANNRVLVWKNAAGFATGAKADMVIGQRDFLSTAAQGPGVSGVTLSTGLNSPTAVVVDSNGNLYVADSGNNRVIRYPQPTQQTGALLVVDLILGQKDISSGSANQGLPAPTAKTLALTSGSSAFVSGLAIEGNNLWVSDSGNNRVLRYSGLLAAQSPANDPAADLVLGQADFVTSSLPASIARNTKNYLAQPAGLVFDQSDNLFVTDAVNRVLVYTPPYATGAFAARIMGIVLPTQQVPNPPAISASTLGATVSNGAPLGVFTIGNTPYVVDTGNHRILQYPSFASFPQENIAFSPAALSEFGQPDFFSNQSNAGNPQSGANTLRYPSSAAVAGNTVFVADSGNNRVLSVPVNADGSLAAANRVLGQVNFQYNSANLIEGREVGFSISGQVLGGGVVIDEKSNHLYVADPLNHRVLGFKDYRTVKAGSTADLVLGQPDFFTAEVNFPTNLANSPQNTGLNSPLGVAVDSSGNVWVADSGNARVVRFPAPFAQSSLANQTPNLVLGQAGFSTKVTDASSSTMSLPVGIAFASDGSVLVSDTALNRVLYFRRPAGGDFTSGAAASTVFGQPDFGPPSETTLVRPRGISIDLDDRLYVANTASTQVQIVIYPNVGLVQNDPPPVFAFNTGTSTSDTLHNPYSIFVNPADGTIWVADTGGQRLLRYPNFQSLSGNPIANSSLTSFAPVGVTVDPFGNPVSAEAQTNRVAFFSPAIDATSSAGGVAGRFSGNAANYFQRFAPGMLASIFTYATNSFQVPKAVSATALPLPTTLGGVQVSVAGIPAPLLYVSASQINLQIPSAVQPGSQPQLFLVTNASTQQVIASGYFRIDATAPGLFTADSTGSGQLAVLNQDNTVNGNSNPAKSGTVIQIFGTGAGIVNGNPPDGTVPSGALPTNSLPDVYINGFNIGPSNILYSGLAPCCVGLWQINAKVVSPAGTDVPPGPVTLFVIYPSVVGESSSIDQYGDRKFTTIVTAPKQQ